MTATVVVEAGALEARARELEHMAGEVAAMVPRIAACAVDARLHELVAYGLFSALPVAADLFSLCLPGVPGSLPDAAAELAALAVAVRAARVAYAAVDAVGWARSELPTAQALVMLSSWRSLHLTVRVVDATGVPLAGSLVDQAGEWGLEQADRLLEGPGRLQPVAPATMPVLPAQPARGLDDLLAVVDAISDTRHPSTVALLHVGDDPPRFVVCLPGLQDATGSDGASADLPGALATLTGHSAYIRGVRHLLSSLPPGSRVLLVGHSQGGMVGEALAEHSTVGGSTIAGLLTAGSPALATRVNAQVAHLSLRNREDPVPLLGRAASAGRPADDGSVVTFSTPGRWVSGAKHGLGSGGYLATAGSDNPKVVGFRKQVRTFLRPGPVRAQFYQVTDR